MKVGYARVSTRGQSLDLQLEQLAAAGCTEQLFREHESGAKDDRPQLKAALEFVRQGDVLIVSKLDRLARSTRHLLQITDTLQRKGVALEILNLGLDTSTAAGRMMLTMLGAIAEFERELLLERQAEGIAKAKTKGAYKGRKPTARAKSADVIAMLGRGVPKTQVAKELKIGIASVYRIAAANGQGE